MRGWSAKIAALCGLLSGCQLFGYELARSTYKSVDGGEQTDAAVARGQDAQTSLDARTDAAQADAAGDACAALNACGGCTTLSAELGSSCGACGLGKYACEGVDAVCQGGDARPVMYSTHIASWDVDARTSDGLGYTYAFDDGSAGTLVPPSGDPVGATAGGAETTTGHAQLMGRGFSGYSGMIVLLNAERCDFDAGSTSGIKFWMKGTASAGVLVGAALGATKDPALCGTGCNDLHQTTLQLRNVWTQYTVKWSDLKQAGWGTQVTFDPSQLQYIQFLFAGGVTYDLSVDELSFI